MSVFTTKKSAVTEWTDDAVNEGRRLSHLCGTTMRCWLAGGTERKKADSHHAPSACAAV